jgi:chemotaxis protein methyltransferase CheR
MYFTPAAAQAVIARVTRSLMPGGYLFLGHAETLRGLSTDFHLCHTHGTFYYQRRGGPPVSSQPPTRSPVLPVSDPGWASGWVDTVQRATDRISALSQVVPPSPVAPPVERVEPVDPLGPSRALFEAERFGDALLALDALPSAAAQDPDALLLRAAVLTHHGRLAAAADACERLLAVDETSAGAHYLLALCREGGGDRSGARDHHQVAAHLDPTFAMPHLRLGLLARREGDLATARRELTEAIALFRREDGSRILLFGGGFGRQALTALCQAELLAAGGRP